MVVLVSLAGTPVLLSFGGKTSGFSVLVDGVGDPVDSSITSDSLVRRVDTDDLVVLVDTVLVDPVRVQDSQVSAPPADAFLGGCSESPLELQVVDTLSDGLTVGSTLGDGLLPVTSSDSDSVDDVALLGLVTQSSSLVGSGRSRCSVDDGELSVLPTPRANVSISAARGNQTEYSPDSGQEEHDIALLLLVEFGNILVGTPVIQTTESARASKSILPRPPTSY